MSTAPPRGLDAVIASLGPWFHNLHLPGGVQTRPDHPLGDFPRVKWSQIEDVLPRDLSGKRALDVGCNAGFYSFELARRGATVVGLDLDTRYLDQARWAAGQLALGEHVTFEEGSVYDLARRPGTFDVVLFMGVFYHLRHPLLALDVVARRLAPDGLLIFQTLTMPGDEVRTDTEDRDLLDRDDLASPGWPKMAFLEHRFCDDPTNWWAPNHAACEALLRAAGLTVLGRPGHEIYACRPDPSPDPVLSGLADDELTQVFGEMP